jgi:serine phosphatase RsbU (regulator of sigma subunit)
VGGDFYDVFPRSTNEWALVVGDVSGKGAEAAAITALARYTLRAAAMEPGPPSQALARLNTTMMADGASQFATVVLAYVATNGAGGLDIRLSLGGHPQPLVVRRDGEVVASGAFGSVLGVIDDPSLEDSTLSLGPSDAMLLYTDGATEAGPREAPLGEQGLSALLARLARHDAQEIVERMEQAVVEAQKGDPRDDIALLALSVERG